MERAATTSASTRGCALLADRNHRLSEGIRGLLETMFGKVFIVADQASLLDGAERLSPALVVVDTSLAQGDMRLLLSSIRDHAPRAKVLLLSVHDEPAVAQAAVAAGADGLVLKRAIASDLLPAVDALLAGRRYFAAEAGYESGHPRHPSPRRGGQ